MSGRCDYDPNRVIHYRLEGKHARPLCGCKLNPGIRPRLMPRNGGMLPAPVKPDGEGVWTGTCSICYERMQNLAIPRKVRSKEPSLTREEIEAFRQLERM